jgi:hypothetical protein
MKRALWVGSLAVAIAGAVMAGAAPPKKPAAGPGSGSAGAAAAVARLKKDEAAVKTGRISLLTNHRRADLPEGTKPEGAREAMARTPLFSQSREYLVFSGANWHRDITVTDPQGNVGQHLLIGVDESVGRVLQERGHGDETVREGSVGVDPEQNGSDLLLLSHGADLLDGVAWTSIKTAGPQVVLSGKRDQEQMTVTLRTQPRYAIERLRVAESVLTPKGPATRGQELAATYDPGKPGLPLKTLEHLVYIVGAVNRGALTTYKVEGAQLNEAIKPEELLVSFPSGTKVTDGRFNPPVRYSLGEKEPTLAELKAMAAKQQNSTLKVGEPAPAWELKTLDGKTARLEDYRGKPVLLTWFASW